MKENKDKKTTEMFKNTSNIMSEKVFFNPTGTFIDVNIKIALSPEEAKEFINYVNSNSVDDEGTYIPFEKSFNYNIALVKYYTDIVEIYKDITKEEIWNLMYNSNILELLESYINKYQIKMINDALDKYEEVIIGSAIRSHNNVSEQLVSSFAGIGYEIQDIVIRLNDYLDAYDKQVLDENGNYDFQPILSAISTLNSGDTEGAIKSVVKQFLQNKIDDEKESNESK